MRICRVQGVGYFGHTPEAYVDVLEAVYQPIKAVDPEAKVLLGGLAYDHWEPGGPFVQDFLDQVLIRRRRCLFRSDEFSLLPAFRAKCGNLMGTDILGKLAFLREKLAETMAWTNRSFAPRPVWLSDPPEHGGSDEVQSRYVVQVFVRSMTADLVSPVIWFMLIDDSDSDPRNWGLLNPDLNPKPSYYAYQTLTRNCLGPFTSELLAQRRPVLIR